MIKKAWSTKKKTCSPVAKHVYSRKIKGKEVLTSGLVEGQHLHYNRKILGSILSL